MPQKNILAFVFSPVCVACPACRDGQPGCWSCACCAPVSRLGPRQGAPVTPGSPAAPASRQGEPPGGTASLAAWAVAGMCRLGELSVSMAWQRDSAALSARLVLANFGAQVFRPGK
jgi:hypothetical protein